MNVKPAFYKFEKDEMDLAKNKLNDILGDPQPFCPAINGKCRKDCVCYANAQIYGVNATKPFSYDYSMELIHVSTPYCRNKMLS
jgi:hypothetical protein